MSRADFLFYVFFSLLGFVCFAKQIKWRMPKWNSRGKFWFWSFLTFKIRASITECELVQECALFLSVYFCQLHSYVEYYHYCLPLSLKLHCVCERESDRERERLEINKLIVSINFPVFVLWTWSFFLFSLFLGAWWEGMVWRNSSLFINVKNIWYLLLEPNGKI